VSVLEEFFKELLDETFDGLGRPVSPHAEAYLTFMLSGFERELSDESLTLRLFGNHGFDRILVLKEVGDNALFIAGWLGRKNVSHMYYSFLGSTAYDELASRSPSSSKKVYVELSEKFPLLIGALEVARDIAQGKGMDTMAAYSEWLRTRSRASENRLKRIGLLLG
jgi:hypothetical protein